MAHLIFVMFISGGTWTCSKPSFLETCFIFKVSKFVPGLSTAIFVCVLDKKTKRKKTVERTMLI